jgi:RNA polymerase sigma factor (sigma-70 family)
MAEKEPRRSDPGGSESAASHSQGKSSSSSQDHSITRLIRRWESGDQAAATDLYCRYITVLVGWLRRRKAIGDHLRHKVDSSRVAHEALGALLQAVATGKFEYRGRGKLFGWLAVAMLRIIYDAAESDDERIDHIDPDDLVIEDRSSHELVELADATREALKGLRPPAAEILDLWMQGYSQRAIARDLDIDPRKVRTVLELIFRRLHRLLSDDEEHTGEQP